MPIQMELAVIKKLKAKRLYVDRLLSARQTALKIKVTEKTLGNWIKAEGWLKMRDEVVEKVIKNQNEPPVIPAILIGDLLEFIRETAPDLAQRVEPIINEYKKLM